MAGRPLSSSPSSLDRKVLYTVGMAVLFIFFSLAIFSVKQYSRNWRKKIWSRVSDDLESKQPKRPPLRAPTSLLSSPSLTSMKFPKSAYLRSLEDNGMKDVQIQQLAQSPYNVLLHRLIFRPPKFLRDRRPCFTRRNKSSPLRNVITYIGSPSKEYIVCPPRVLSPAAPIEITKDYFQPYGQGYYRWGTVIHSCEMPIKSHPIKKAAGKENRRK